MMHHFSLRQCCLEQVKSLKLRLPENDNGGIPFSMETVLQVSYNNEPQSVCVLMVLILACVRVCTCVRVSVSLQGLTR